MMSERTFGGLKSGAGARPQRRTAKEAQLPAAEDDLLVQDISAQFRVTRLTLYRNMTASTP